MIRTFRYQLFMPKPNERGTLLDTYGGELPSLRAYECVFAGEVEVEEHNSRTPKIIEAMTPLHACELLFQRHNVGDLGDDNRPRPQDIRSMSVGDIVRFPELAEGLPNVFIVESVGFRPLPETERPDLDDARPWQDVNHRDIPIARIYAPMPACQCESDKHFNGGDGHRYQDNVVADVAPCKTQYGTFHVCRDCRETCMTAYILTDDA